MYSNGQTLVHKLTNKLVRLLPHSTSIWKSSSEDRTYFISEKGHHFIGTLKDYTHVVDELGRPYIKAPSSRNFVDETAKKYLVSDEALIKMREKRLLTWEKSILKRMKTGSGPCDIIGKKVFCPFSDGSSCTLVKDFFLKRRKAKLLYIKQSEFSKDMVDGPSYFKHTDGQYWLYDYILSSLIVIHFN